MQVLRLCPPALSNTYTSSTPACTTVRGLQSHLCPHRAGTVGGSCASAHASSGASSGRVVVPVDAAAAHSVLNLAGRRVRVYWDLDNIKPRPLLPAVQALRELLCDCGGYEEAFTLYGNSLTMPALRGESQHLEAAGMQCIEVAPRPEAADMRLVSDAYMWASSQRGRPDACAVVVSGDTGFADVLGYMSYLGVFTVIMSQFPVRKTALGRAPNLQAHALSKNCNAALMWSNQAITATGSRGGITGCWLNPSPPVSSVQHATAAQHN